uniref:Uncharacterized protein n=1 Tax=Oryza nivara TaxID=4536 RepID=A0A0E0JAF4_ORYNI
MDAAARAVLPRRPTRPWTPPPTPDAAVDLPRRPTPPWTPPLASLFHDTSSVFANGRGKRWVEGGVTDETRREERG